MRETTQAIVSGAIRDLRDSWRVLAQTDLVYKLISFALLTPGTLLLLRWAMSRTGTLVVADTEIATFFLTTRQGILALIVVGAILTGITALEMTCLMAIGLAAANGRHLTARGALAFGASRALLVLRLAANIVARLLVGLLPFAAAVGVVYWTLLRYHDINFYLSQRPPEFWTAVSIAAVIVAVLAVILLWTIARWTMALPLVLFEGVSPRRALAESSARSAGHRSIAIAALAMWAALASALLAVATWVPDFIGRALAPGFSGSMPMLLGFITGLVLLWAVLGLVTAVVNVSMLSLVLLRLYLRVVDLREPGALPELGADTWGGARRLPRAVRIGVVVVSILAALGVVLVVMNVARRNQPVLVIAHRGASAAAPENTLAAFRLGADLGADFVELDVQESEDGEVVVVHDSDLMKVGGSPLKIWEAPAAALRGGRHRQPQGAAVCRRARAHARRGLRALQRPGPRRRRTQVLWALPAARRARRRDRRGRRRGERHHLHVARSRHGPQAQAASTLVESRRARRKGHRRPHLARRRFSRGRRPAWRRGPSCSGRIVPARRSTCGPSTIRPGCLRRWPTASMG